MSHRITRNHLNIRQRLVFAILGAALFVQWGVICTATNAQQMDREQFEKLKSLDLPTEPSDLLAIVGGDPILVGDILPKVDRRIAGAVKGNLSEVPADELKVLRLQLMRNALGQTIQLRMLGQVFLMSKVGSASAEQRQDAQEQISMQATKSFYEMEVPRMLKELDLNTPAELDAVLREKGGSIESAKDDYITGVLGQLMLQQMIPKDPEVTLNEIRDYYAKHRDKYQNLAQARWEQLTVLFKNFPNREAALEAISAMGSEAYFGGNVQQVAKEKSQEPLARFGGVHDWTSQGSLRSKPLDEQIFIIPLNRLSQIIEDADGFHIVRVLERKEAGMTPLSEVQDAIRKTLKEEKQAAAERSLMEKIRRDVPVWTRYPEDVPGSRPLEEVALLGRPNANEQSPLR